MTTARQILTTLHREIDRLNAELAKRPWIDGTDIHIGNPEGSPDGPDAWGIIGKTNEGVDALVQKAKEDQREADLETIEASTDSQSEWAGVSTVLRKLRATPLVP